MSSTCSVPPRDLVSVAVAAEQVFGMDRFSRSGKPDEIYRNAGFDPAGLRKRILG